jgi:hypothetical protein
VALIFNWRNIMETFFTWFEKNRKTIGYVVGGMTLLTGLADLAVGHVLLGTMWIVIGVAILFDTKTFK